MKSNITNGRFEFNLKKSRALDMRALILTADSVLSYDDFMQEKRNRTDDSKMIMVDDLEITTGKIVADATVKGSPLNNDLGDMFSTIKTGDYEKYFSDHPDSPVSMLFLKSLAQISRSASASTSFDCKKYFGLLSDRLQQSPDGLFLAQVIGLPK